MNIAEIERNGGVITMGWSYGPFSRRERIKIGGDYPLSTPLADQIFESMGIMHIIAPVLPELIKTGFNVLPWARNMIDLMYEANGRNIPAWEEGGRGREKSESSWQTSEKAVIVPYSGGKESMFNVQEGEKQGKRTILVHVSGINPEMARDEYRLASKQSEIWGKRLHVVDFETNQTNRSRSAMETRDLLISALSIPFALEYGANSIVMEGGYFSGIEESGVPFAFRASTWREWNRQLSMVGIPVESIGNNTGEFEVIRRLLIEKPELLKLTSSCYQNGARKQGNRNKFQSRYPSIKLYESMCGSCLKCRTISVARALYDSEYWSMLDKGQMRDFVHNNEQWISRNQKYFRDNADPYFLIALDEIKRKLEGYV